MSIMFARASRTLLGSGQRLPRVVPLVRVPLLQRYLSRETTDTLPTYSSLPATLHYYRLYPTSSLFDRKQRGGNCDDLPDKGLQVAEDGLVYPNFDVLAPNGVLLRKNTSSTHLLYQFYYEKHYLDPEYEGELVEPPYILTIPKGTRIPNHFILSRCDSNSFCLEPSHGMTVDDLNRLLDEFYSKHALEEDAGDFFEKYLDWYTRTLRTTRTRRRQDRNERGLTGTYGPWEVIVMIVTFIAVFELTTSKYLPW